MCSWVCSVFCIVSAVCFLYFTSFVISAIHLLFQKSRLERDLDDLSDRASKEHMEVCWSLVSHCVICSLTL